MMKMSYLQGFSQKLSRRFTLFLMTGIVIFLLHCSYQTLAAQTTEIPPYTVAWSPNGAFIATGGEGFVRVWDSSTEALLFDWQAQGTVITGLTWHPNSMQVASVSSDHLLRTWNVGIDGTYINISADVVFPLGNSFSPNDVAWSPDGSYIAISGLYVPTVSGRMLIWDTNSEQLLGDILPGERRVYWMPDSLHVIVGQEDASPFVVPIFNFQTEGVYALTPQYDTSALQFATSPDGRFVAVGFVDGVVVIQDVVNRVEYSIFNTNTNSPITDLVWTLNNHLLAVVSSPTTREVWDVQAGQRLITFAVQDGLRVDLSPDGLNVVVMNDSTTIALQPANNPPPTPTPIPTVTPLPPNMARLRLTSLCSPNPASYRVWRVRNTNPYPVPFTWDVYNTAQQGSGVVPAANGSTPGEVMFQTITVPNSPNTTRVFVSGAQQDVKASTTTQCS